MTPCDHIDRYCDGELSSELRGAFEAHLGDCQDCALRIERWSRISRELTLAVREAEEALPASSDAAIDSLVDRARSRARTSDGFSIPLRPALAFATSLAAVIAVYVFMRAPEPSQAPAVAPAEEAPGTSASFEMAARLFMAKKREAIPMIASLNEPIEAPSFGRVVVSLANDQIGMAPETSLTVVKSTKEYTLIRLDGGTAVFSVSPRGGLGEFVVRARQVSVRVVGTKFAVFLENENVGVSVVEGAVKVASEQGGAFDLGAGKRLSVTGSGDVSTSELSEEDAAALMRLLSEEFVEIRPAQAEKAEGEPGEDEAVKTEAAATKETSGKAGGARHKGSLETWRNWIIEGRIEEASSALEAYLTRKPRDETAWSLLADCRRKAGDWRGAVGAYREVISLAPGNQAEQARFRAGALLQDKLGAHAEAIELLDDYVESGRGDASLVAEALYRLARSHLALGHRDKALDLLGEVTERHRGSPAATRAASLIEKIKSGD